jgi:hypothetical protein
LPGTNALAFFCRSINDQFQNSFTTLTLARLQEGDGHQVKRREGPSSVHLSGAAEASHFVTRQLLHRHSLHLAEGQHAASQTPQSK